MFGAWGESNWMLGIAASVFYLSNWVQVTGINVGPMSHAWTLAIEEQFYTVWPALLILLGRRWLVALALVGILVAIVARGQFGDALYYATFTRIDAVLAGCLVAMLGIRLRPSFGFAGVLLLVWLGLISRSTPDVWLLPATILASMLVVTASWKPLGLLAAPGKRAYGSYLWQLPLGLAFGPVGLFLSIPAAELSYRAIERPGRGLWALRLRRVVVAAPSAPDAASRAPL